uniref:Uncharacterized protein n=1 Tax=Arundo donax TaxID=35708 RepID=A0A0A9FKT0_ARUDO
MSSFFFSPCIFLLALFLLFPFTFH